jgi:hypothetical protein
MRSLLALVSLFASLGPTLTAAETDVKTTPAPGHLMTMDEVRDRFGAPDRTLEAVGDPPITRWIYAGYTVYFEHDLVLTSVRHRAP